MILLKIKLYVSLDPELVVGENLRLGSRADTGHRETDVDGRTNTTEEELSLQEDLTVSDGNDLECSKR